MSCDYSKLFDTIGITIKDAQLIKNVFVHRSYLNEHKGCTPSNEKLEFLGDSVLSLATSIYLYRHYPHLAEGQYTDIKAAIVRMESLATVASSLGLGEYLMLSRGEEANNGRTNTNILADCFEALIAAIFIDQGFETAYEFIVKHLFANRLGRIIETKSYLSPKSHLQEIVQERFRELPQYTIVSEVGPEHNKIFTVNVSIQGAIYAHGTGRSKKQAEEAAARAALEKLNQR
jgi:ribonuclease-3